MTLAVGYDGGESARHALAAAIELARNLEESLLIVCAVAPGGGVGDEYQSTEVAVLDELTPMVNAALAHAKAPDWRWNPCSLTMILSERSK